MFNVKKYLKSNNICKPPYDYDFLLNLDEKEYPNYLAKLFHLKTGEKLDLKHPKTFNQKIQWIKLYGITDLMRQCTDKVAVRDYIREKIGKEYLKPAIQIIYNCSPSTSGRGRGEGITLANDNNLFDQIDFNNLPNSFVIKCNHGCKWHYIIKNKEKYLSNTKLVEITRRQITGWLKQKYCFWGGFEMQYRDINHKILIEAMVGDEINKTVSQIHCYCFNGIPKLFIKFFDETKISIWNENFQSINTNFGYKEKNIITDADNNVKQASMLSKKLSENALKIYDLLSKYFVCDFDEIGSIGKRYRRQDEIGTPFCVTFDFGSVNDNCVTIRERDTMQQTRVNINDLKESGILLFIILENSATCIVNLDSCIGPIVDSEYSIDFIRVKKIVYEDGSVWHNYFLLL